MKKPVVAKSMRCCSARVIEMRFRLHNAELMPNSNMAYYAQSIISTTTKIVPNVLPAIDLGMVACGAYIIKYGAMAKLQRCATRTI